MRQAWTFFDSVADCAPRGDPLGAAIGF